MAKTLAFQRNCNSPNPSVVSREIVSPYDRCCGGILFIGSKRPLDLHHDRTFHLVHLGMRTACGERSKL